MLQLPFVCLNHRARRFEVRPCDRLAASMPDLLNRTSWFEFLTKIASLIALFYATVFFYGWVYLVTFFSEFKVDLWALDIPIYNFPAGSFFAFERILVLSFILLAVISALRMFLSVIKGRVPIHVLAELVANVRWLRETLGTARPFPVILLWLVIFTIIFISANNQGVRAAQRGWTGSPHVHLAFKATDRQQFEPALVKANDEHHLSLLAQTKDLVVVFDPRTAAKPPGHVFVVARTEVTSVFIWP